MTRSLYELLFPPASGRTDSQQTHLANRLKNLFRSGYLDRFDSHQSKEPAYGLAQRGAEHLIARGYPVRQTDWTAKNRTVISLSIAHTLTVSRLRVALEVSLPLASPRVALDIFEREKQSFRAVWGHDGATVSLNPDAFFKLEDFGRHEDERILPFFLEADRSTMTIGRLVAKLERYVWLYDDDACRTTFRVPVFTALVVCKSAERAWNILDLVGAKKSPIPHDHRPFFLFTSEELYREQPTNVLAAIWRGADNPDERRALIASPVKRVQ
jgi:hypothetical protein